MGDSLKEKSGEKAVQRALSPLPSSVYDDTELPFGSPVSKAMPRIRFLPRELPDGVSSPSAMSSATMETHVLDVESPGATLERKKQGGGIVYFPPENLAEYLDSSLVTPVTGGVSPSTQRSQRSSNGGRRFRSFFDEHCGDSDDEAAVKPDAPAAKTDVRASTSTSTSRSEAVFYCAFCMRTRPGADRRRFEGNGGCSHEFCKKCLENYLYHRIMVGHHTLHPCPKFGEESCRATASNADVRWIARADVFEEHSKRLEGRRGACEECGHRGRRTASQPSPPAPPPPPPTSSPLSPRELAATAADADEDHTCQSCGSTRKRHLHLHLHHHHHHNDLRQTHPPAGSGAAGKSTRRWLPRRAAASADVAAAAAAAKADGGDKTQRQRIQKREQLVLTAADLTPVAAGGGEARKDSAGKTSLRWWSPREWWTKARSARRSSRR